MKNLNLKMLMLLLGVVMFSTSCKKSEDDPRPSIVTPINPITYDTVSYTYELGVLNSDSTIINTDSYADNLVYTLNLSDYVSGDISMADIVSIDLYNKGNFYDYDTNSTYKTVTLYANYLTYQTNNQTIKARVVIDSTVNEVTINFKLMDDVAFEVSKYLINNSRLQTSQMSSGSMMWVNPAPSDFIPTNKTKNYGLSFTFYPNDFNSTTSVTIAGILTQENSFITLQLIKGKLQVVINDNISPVNSKVNRYSIVSFSNSTVYIKDNNNNSYSLILN